MPERASPAESSESPSRKSRIEDRGSKIDRLRSSILNLRSSILDRLWLQATQFGAYSYNYCSPGAEPLQNTGSSASVREGTVIANLFKRLGGDGVITPTEIT